MESPRLYTRRRFLQQSLVVQALALGGLRQAARGAVTVNLQVGPWKMIEAGAGGAFFAVGAGPTGIVLVAADLSGGYISYDQGKSWHDRGQSEGVAFSSHACAVGFDPEDERLIYMGTSGVLYRSSDRGATFLPCLPQDWDPAARTGAFVVAGEPLDPARAEASPLWHSRLYWTAITFSKSNPRIGYAAAHSDFNTLDGIVFKTVDRGQSWRPVKAFVDDLSASPPVFNEDKRIQKIVVDPRNPDVVYLLSQPDKFSRDQGRFGLGPQTNLRRSADGGATWSVLTGVTTVTYTKVRRRVARYDAGGRQVIDPLTREAAVYDGTKAPISFTEAVLLRDVLDFELDPVDPQTLYATKGSREARSEVPGAGTYRSSDGGQRWTKVDDRFGAIKVKAGGILPSQTIIRRFDFVGWEGSPRISERKFPQLWESRDGGQTWTLKSGPAKFKFGAIDPHFYGATSAYAKTIAASLADPDDYYWVDSQWVYRSDDGGASFRSAGSNAVVKSDGQKWYATTGISNIVSLTLKVSEADPKILVGGCADIGLWRSLDRGETWQCANEPGYLSDWIYYGGQAQAIGLDPERPNVMWAGLGGGFVDQVMIKSEAYGKLGTWKRSHRGLPLEKRKASSQEGAALRGLSIDRNSPRDRRTLFVVADDEVYKSVDDGASWMGVFDLTGGRPFDYRANKRGKTNFDRQGATAVDPNDGRNVYAGGTDGLFRSRRGGEPGTWERMGPIALNRVQKIVVSRVNPRRIYVAAFGAGLFRSEDHGDTWKQILQDRFLRGAAVHPGNDRIVFAASANVYTGPGLPESGGALLSTDDGLTWRQTNEGLSWPFVRDVEFNPKDPSEVFLVTPGTSFHVGRFRFEDENRT